MAAAQVAVVTLDSDSAQTPFCHFVQDQKIAVFESMVLDSGAILQRPQVAYKTWGRLNDTRDNVMVVCHALSGTCDVADWWGPLMGRGKGFDPSVFFIICANVLGSPYGSSSPVSINPETQQMYGADFPHVTIRDTVRLHKMLLDALQIRRVQVVVGGSLGGMQVLEWAFFGSEYVRSIIPIATSGKHSAWCISWSEAQRQAIISDPQWMDGRYSPSQQPARGLSAARMTAMLTYRSRDSFESRFGRKLQPSSGENKGSRSADLAEASGELGQYNPRNDVFTAQSYLRYQGDKFVKRFDANCYLRITEMLDSHDVSLRRGDYYTVLRSIQQPACIIGVDSDGLFTVQEQHELKDTIPNSELVMITSPDGHDGFLLEFRQMNSAILGWLQRRLSDLYTMAAAAAADGADANYGEDLAAEESMKNRKTAVGEAWADVEDDRQPMRSVDLLKW